MFEKFGDYMFSLLFAPLKRVKRSANQLYIFFKVVGRHFDDVKATFFRVREESNVISCSEIMLPIHGEDRDMPRLEGEDWEGYRTRLSMKGLIAEKAGTSAGIRYLAKSLKYDDVEIGLYQDPSRWAEVKIRFISKRAEIENKDILLTELNKIKPARTLFNLSICTIRSTQANLYTGFAIRIGLHITVDCEIPEKLDVTYLPDEDGNILTDEDGNRLID